jgi:hypothetical protein
VASSYQLQWHSIPLIARTAASAAPEKIQAAAFDTVGSKAVLFNAHNYAVIAVSAVKNADATKAGVIDLHQASAQLSALWGQLIEHCFVGSVMSDAHVVVKKS